MRSIVLGGVAATILLAVAGCAAPGTGGASAPAAPVPTGAEVQAQLAELPTPSADSPVLAIATVLEQDGTAILCVGPVAESAPPQCDGPELIGWDWAAFEHQETGGVRWVQGVAVEGTYDAEAATFTQTGEPMSAAAITLPAIEVPAGDLDDATIEAVQADFFAIERADVLGAHGEQGTVVVEVVYDDGSVQAAIDEIYGAGVVFVVSALRGGADEPPVMEPPMDTAAPVITGEEAQARLAELPTPSATEPVLAYGDVLEADDGPNAGVPMLCTMMLTSYPPQCGGPEVIGWDWSAVDHEAANGVRWTESGLAMRVTYDGVHHTMTPLEMVDPSSIDTPLPSPHPAGPLDAAAIAQLQDDLIELARPDIMGFGGGNGSFAVEVVYDDGSIQAAFDEIYGPGAVHVTSWLR